MEEISSFDRDYLLNTLVLNPELLNLSCLGWQASIMCQVVDESLPVMLMR